MKFSIYDEDGNMKPELKIGMAIDDYKLPNKEEWWVRCLKKLPEVQKNYDFVEETVDAGITKNTLMCYRIYRLKAK